VFNVCGTVGKGLPPQCGSTAGLNIAGAVQIDITKLADGEEKDYCRVVGDYTEQSFAVDLLEHSDPTKGIKLKYMGGEQCANGERRRFEIDLVCADRLNARPSHSYELSHCAYTATIPSVYGCPVECPVGNRALCSGNGECSYDIDKHAARCYCYHGFSGNDCADKGDISTDLNYSPALLGLIVTLAIIITLLVAGIVLMIKQVQAFKEDMTHYQMLRGDGENEDSATV
jgi:hypothetical protein